MAQNDLGKTLFSHSPSSPDLQSRCRNGVTLSLTSISSGGLEILVSIGLIDCLSSMQSYETTSQILKLAADCNFPIFLQSEDSDNESVDSLDVLR